MRIEAIPTHAITIGDDLEKILDQYVPILNEKTIIAVTSKIVSLCQKHVVCKNDISKEALIKQEADAWIEPDCHDFYLTIKSITTRLLGPQH